MPVTLVWRTDVHLSDHTPRSRTDNWTDTVLRKLTSVGEIARNSGAPSIGGHAVTLVGYKRTGSKVLFRLRNSWGQAWGDEGYIWLPSEWITLGICGEAYALRAVRNLRA